MATTYKVLGQVKPSATTNTTLYTVPSSTQTVCSTLTICNTSGTAATFRVAIRPDGAAISNEHYIIYGSTVAGNDTIFLTLGITLGDTDVVTVYSSAGDLVYNLFGSEVA